MNNMPSNIQSSKQQIIETILTGTAHTKQLATATAFAPANIALCKYWGKRDQELNLPVTDSLSISLGDKGVTTTITVSDQADQIILNSKQLPVNSPFGQRICQFLDLVRPPGMFFQVVTSSNIPISAGLASSAAGFAALVKALDQLFAWRLTNQQLSILARLGSGSASRSLWHGFVLWQKGERADGMDSYAQLMPIAPTEWQDLRVGLLIFSSAEKKISSRVAMQVTVQSCPFYELWPRQVAKTLTELKQALATQNFVALGQATETNSLAMHALMLASWPAIIYSTADTLQAMQAVWQLRAAGVAVYFTQDAGPNLKLLFLAEQQAEILAMFPNIQLINPWI